MSHLFHRLFFDKDLDKIDPTFSGVSEPMPLKAVEEHVEKIIDTPTFQIGGKVKDNKVPYFQRWNLYYFIFFMSVFLALLVMRDGNIARQVLKVKDFSDLTMIHENPNKRWELMTRLTIVFICLVLAFNIALILGVWIFRTGVGVVDDTGAKFKELFWEYKDPFGKMVKIGKNYMMTLMLVLFLTFVCYLGWSKWFPDWYDSMYFQSVNKKKDDSQAQKYLYVYGLFLIAMMLFFMILLDLRVLDDNKLYMYYNIMFFLAYMIVSFVILKEFKAGKEKKLALLVVLVFLLFMAYPVLISLIKQETKGKDIFNSKFLMNIMFNFGLPKA